MKDYEYPFDEFLGHFQALEYVLKYSFVHVDYNNLSKVVDIGDDKSMEAHIGRVWDYLSQLDYKPEEIIEKGSHLVGLLYYLKEHQDVFVKHGFVIVNADNCPPLIKGSLLKVLHEHYCAPGVPRNLPPKKFVKRAKSLESKHR